MAPSDVHVQTAGAWNEGEMARDPGGRCDQLPANRQRWRAAGNGGAPSCCAVTEDRPVASSPELISSVCEGSDPSRRTGRRRAAVPKIAAARGPKGNPLRGRKPSSGCGVGAPRHPSHPRGKCPAGLSALAPCRHVWRLKRPRPQPQRRKSADGYLRFPAAGKPWLCDPIECGRTGADCLRRLTLLLPLRRRALEAPLAFMVVSQGRA